MEQQNKKVLVLRGTVDEKKLASLPRFEGCILATGDVKFESDTTIPCMIAVMGNLEAKKLTVKGSLICEGKCYVEDLKVNGDLSIRQKGTEIQHLKLTGALTSTPDKTMCDIGNDVVQDKATE